MLKLHTGIAALAIAFVAACGTEPGAPATMTSLAPNVDVEESMLRTVRYEAVCVLKYRDVEQTALSHEKVLGTGNCNVFPWGRSTVTFEGIEIEEEGKMVFEGWLSYRFADGSRLNSIARLSANEVGATGTVLPMEFAQTFKRGTGRLVAFRSGQGTGTAKLWQKGYELKYVAAGDLIFAVEP